jgi:hypothetical protein
LNFTINIATTINIVDHIKIATSLVENISNIGFKE